MEFSEVSHLGVGKGCLMYDNILSSPGRSCVSTINSLIAGRKSSVYMESKIRLFRRGTKTFTH